MRAMTTISSNAATPDRSAMLFPPVKPPPGMNTRTARPPGGGASAGAKTLMLRHASASVASLPWKRALVVLKDGPMAGAESVRIIYAIWVGHAHDLHLRPSFGGKMARRWSH